MNYLEFEELTKKIQSDSCGQFGASSLDIDRIIKFARDNARFDQPKIEAADGTARMAHYGQGEQPWDTIKRTGWGPAFAASNVLKYLRRTKELQHSLESAKWYYVELTKLAKGDVGAAFILRRLDRHLLTDEEKARLV